MADPTAEIQKAPGIKDPVVAREVKRFGGLGSLVTRVVLAASAIGGGATIVACGESFSGNPAAFTIDTPATVETKQAIAESFKDVPRTQIVLRPELTPWTTDLEQRQIWQKGNASFHRPYPSVQEQGALTILLSEPFTPEDPSKQWRGFMIDESTGKPLVILEIRSAAASSLIDPKELAPENKGLEALRILFSAQEGVVDGRRPYTVYIQKVDTQGYKPIEGSLHALSLTPSSSRGSK